MLGHLAGATVLVACRPLRSLAALAAPPWTVQPDLPLFLAPDDPAAWPQFREALAQWRTAERAALNYDDGLYRREDFAPWVSRCFACGFLMVNDERLLDPAMGRFTADRLLDEAERDFGGFDAVVLWHAYPRIGFDDRNQYDFYRHLPGGLSGLKELAGQLHQRGIKVFVDWNPWDNDTRPEGRSHVAALADLVAAIDADGIFLDTLPRGDVSFRPSLDERRRGVVLESELALPTADIAAHHMSWAQWFTDSQAPGVLRNKWFERRHMQHQINRWDRDHTSELHTSWMNGSGMMIWENVFGSWNGWSPGDRSILRSMLPIQRRFAAVFAGEGWMPLVPVDRPGTFASLWEENGIRVWTLVNRSDSRQQVELVNPERRPGESWFDLVSGQPVSQPSAALDSRGIGCLLAAPVGRLGADFNKFLASQARLASRRETQRTIPPRETALRHVPLRRGNGVPAGMIEIPSATFVLKTSFRLRECGCYDSEVVPDIRNELHRRATFERRVTLLRYGIDRTPVTNEAFRDFLKASGWRPRHATNFLKHWPDWRTLRMPPGKDDHPVVYVDLEDARAYATWARKSLPTEEAWQYAAQGPQEFTWPWGNEWREGVSNAGREERDPTGAVVGRNGDTTSVHAFPDGASPFGVLDLSGNVWEWTESERSDGRTRFALLKGGSYYSRTRSDWYADGGAKPNDFVAKFLLSWPGLDRCATIGFRCMVGLDEA